MLDMLDDKDRKEQIERDSQKTENYIQWQKDFNILLLVTL